MKKAIERKARPLLALPYALTPNLSAGLVNRVVTKS